MRLQPPPAASPAGESVPRPAELRLGGSRRRRGEERRSLSSAARRERMLRLPRGAPVFEISTLFYLITPAAL